MTRTWILQANPKLYDVDAALKSRPTIYWRIPQYAGQVKAGDHALVWRAGAQAGIVGWGVFRTDPQRYDLSGDVDPFIKPGFDQQLNEYYAPLRVWPAEVVPKASVAVALPDHRIVTAPMGTVFPVDADDLSLLDPLLAPLGYDLQRPDDRPFVPLRVLPDAEYDIEEGDSPGAVHAKITPALFLLSSTSEHPVEVTIEGDALRLLLAERDARKFLPALWSAVGVYLLFSAPNTEGAVLSVYVGKALDLRSRVKGGHEVKTWSRCLLIQRVGDHPFNASDISWLERRLIDVLREAPQFDLLNKQAPPLEMVPEYKAEILERTVVAAFGVLGVLGAHVA